MSERPDITAAEVDFCRAWTAHRTATSLWFSYLCGIAVNAFSLAGLPFFADPVALPYLMTVHATVMALSVVGLVLRRRAAFGRGLMAALMLVIMFGYEGVLRYAASTLHSPRDVLFASAGVIAYATICMPLFPYSGLAVGLLSAGLTGGAFLAMQDVEGGSVWVAIFGGVLAFTLILRLISDGRLRREARREFLFRSQVAPAHIVRHATGESLDLGSVFKPELKFSVCISTDWRNYQELSGRIAPSQLAMTLNAYYDLCHSLLAACLPAGNYFSDWIADELFIVMFPVDGESHAALVDAAVQFSADLLLAKDGFVRLHGQPRSIDVGISAGESLIGLMGPSGLRKATAMGEIPGRARRLQGAGKLLRRSRGDTDRIVFGRECKDLLTKSYPAQHLLLAANETVRDLRDRELFFLEPQTMDPALLKREA